MVAADLLSVVGEVRTILTFRVTADATERLLPTGWTAEAIATGEASGANLRVALTDQLVAHDSAGRREPTGRFAPLVIPAIRPDMPRAVAMVVGVLTSRPQYDPYGNSVLAQVEVDRRVRTNASGTSVAEETWSFRTSDGDHLELDVVYGRAATVHSVVEVPIHSGTDPSYYRIYRIEQAADVVRGGGVDRVSHYRFRATGPLLGRLFEGSPTLVSITSLPWCRREIHHPSGMEPGPDRGVRPDPPRA